jgi:hypothetical protein
MSNINKLVQEAVSPAVAAGAKIGVAAAPLGALEGIGAIGQYHARKAAEQAKKSIEQGHEDEGTSKLLSSYLDHQSSGQLRPISRLLGRGSYDHAKNFGGFDKPQLSGLGEKISKHVSNAVNTYQGS